MTKTKTTTFRFDEATLTALDDLSEAIGLSRAEVLRTSIDYLGIRLTQLRKQTALFLAGVKVEHGAALLTVRIDTNQEEAEQPAAEILVNGEPTNKLSALVVLDRGTRTLDVFLTDSATERDLDPVRVHLGSKQVGARNHWLTISLADLKLAAVRLHPFRALRNRPQSLRTVMAYPGVMEVDYDLEKGVSDVRKEYIRFLETELERLKS